MQIKRHDTRYRITCPMIRNLHVKTKHRLVHLSTTVYYLAIFPISAKQAKSSPFLNLTWTKPN